MVNLIKNKEEKDLTNNELNSKLTTEEEVNKLKEELARKEDELKSLKEKDKKDEVDLLADTKKEEEKIKEEQERVRIAPEKSIKTNKPVKTPTQKQIKDDDLVKDLQHVMSMDKPKQVKTLIYIAFQKGLNYAVSIAQKLKDPYILDEFHDTLVNNLYDLLKKKNKIK